MFAVRIIFTYEKKKTNNNVMQKQQMKKKKEVSLKSYISLIKDKNSVMWDVIV